MYPEFMLALKHLCEYEVKDLKFWLQMQLESIRLHIVGNCKSNEEAKSYLVLKTS